MLSLKASVLASVFCVTFRRDFDLSLNGKDALVNGEVPITDIGIVPGDIIKLIVKDSSKPNPGKPILHICQRASCNICRLPAHF